MKTKLILISILAFVVVVTVASSRTPRHGKEIKKAATAESRVNKGLPMEDRNQLN